MTKYLLKAWQEALDKKINEVCRKHEHDEEPEPAFKEVWYYVWIWFEPEIKNNDMIEELIPFAEAYCDRHIRSTLRSYKIYRVPTHVKNKIRSK